MASRGTYPLDAFAGAAESMITPQRVLGALGMTCITVVMFISGNKGGGWTREKYVVLGLIAVGTFCLILS